MRAPRPDDAALTGAGVVTALGYGLEATFEALAAGQSAVSPTDGAGAEAAVSHAAVIEAPYLRSEVPREMEPQIKFLNAAGELAVEATIEALAAADLPEAGFAPERHGLYLAQMDSGDWSCPEFRPAVLAATEDFTKPLTQEELNRASTRRVKPFFMLESLKNNAFSFLATMFGLRGVNTSVAGFAGPTTPAIAMALRRLQERALDAVLICAAARPTSATARLELTERGIPGAPGDGAGALHFERAAEATARGVADPILVLGQGAATVRPADGSWSPTLRALVSAASMALAEAEIEAGDLMGIVAPDLGEEGLEAALAALPATADVPIVRWKGALGHAALAADTLEVALAAEAVRRGELPGAGDAVAGKAVLVLTAGLLGQTGALVLGRP